MYYMSESLFASQDESDRTISTLCDLLKVTREDLNVVSRTLFSIDVLLLEIDLLKVLYILFVLFDSDSSCKWFSLWFNDIFNTET